jgi:hypothetical protein
MHRGTIRSSIANLADRTCAETESLASCLVLLEFAAVIVTPKAILFTAAEIAHMHDVS